VAENTDPISERNLRQMSDNEIKLWWRGRHKPVHQIWDKEKMSIIWQWLVKIHRSLY